MSGETEAAGDILTGAVIAKTVDPSSGAPSPERAQDETNRKTCLNCGTELTGPYCASCGQPAHLHRSFASLGHEILHGVFHFEGKIWRTLPELMFHPGRLTRRYIDGERAKFVSPMALFLFTVFLIFAVFAFTSPSSIGAPGARGTPEWRAGQQAAIESITAELEELRARLADPKTPVAEHAEIQAEIEDLESGLDIMKSVAAGDLKRLVQIEGKVEKSHRTSAADGDTKEGESESPRPGSFFDNITERVGANPDLLSYKIKTNAYKYSWGLIPLSLPFLWLLFFWRRDIHLYDHAIFATYSISFMMLFGLLLALASALGVAEWVWETAFVVVPPIHIYKQLRGTYGLSRAGALVRLFFLSIFIVLILVLFFTLLVVAGALT